MIDSKYYQNALRARTTTDMLIGNVSQVALNHIGLLVVDEIQNVCNSKNGKSLVGMLTQLINNSGISICMVGTPESAVFFEQAMQLARRSLGLRYDVMEYGASFRAFCETVFSYQYVKQRTEITDPQYARFIPLTEKKKALYHLGHDSCDVHHLFPVLPRNDGERYLRFCPSCVKEDRETYGEAYWHAQKYCDWRKNAKYHYVKGYVCWKSDKSNIYSAIEWLDNAISLDHEYFQARILRCQLGAFASEEKEKVMSLFSDLEENFQGDEKKAEIYEAKGFIYKAYGDYDLAEEWMMKAEKANHCIEYLINLGILYYSRATENNEHGKRLLKIKIDYPDIFKAYECFQKAMQEMTKEEINLYKKDFIDVYISTCMLCEHPEQIENIQILIEDKKALDYETQRYLTFHEAIRGKNANLDLLSEEDKIFLSYVEKAECGEMEEAFHLLKENINVGETSDLERKYNMALQLAIALKRYDEFKQLRANVIRNKIECPYMDLYDAEYYDLIGDYGRSKKFYDTHIQESDGLYILNQSVIKGDFHKQQADGKAVL